MAAGPNDLCLYTDVQTYLGLAPTVDAALLQQLVTAASGFIQAWLNRTFAITAYTEMRDGSGGTRLMTANYPVVSVTGVQVDQTVIAAQPASGQVGYFNDSTSILLYGYCFNRGQSNIVLQYTAGFATVPFEIAQACIELVALKYKQKDRVGVSAKTLAAETISFFIGDMPASVKTILNDYKKVIPV
jgi:hypothetical protein